MLIHGIMISHSILNIVVTILTVVTIFTILPVSALYVSYPHFLMQYSYQLYSSRCINLHYL